MSTPAGNRTWKHRLKQVLLIGLLACLGFGGWLVWQLYVLVNDDIPTAYAGWTAWELIDTHLNERSNQWPRSIADLEAVIPAHRQRGLHTYCKINQLTNWIAINWHVEPQSLRAIAKTNASHPLLVTRRDGEPIYPVWKAREPNHKLEEILGLPTGFLRATN